ncbi:hypothetical protein AB0L59_22600 [Streptomyces sp. NPDC052109]|uniref:hypothetical protein n=1 Tax=Streptomyces sp. NPDC052109 TaxID=3155527 RepID=UPI00341FA49D
MPVGPGAGPAPAPDLPPAVLRRHAAVLEIADAALAMATAAAAGVGTGAIVSLLHRAGVRPHAWLGAVLTGGLAMTLTDAPIAGLDISDPRTWWAADWTADAIPHLGYGLVTYSVIASA